MTTFSSHVLRFFESGSTTLRLTLTVDGSKDVNVCDAYNLFLFFLFLPFQGTLYIIM